jgi:hypothetical protein
MRPVNHITLRQAIEYEVRASWWTPFVPFHRLAGCYFRWKALRKYRRYFASLITASRLQRIRHL